MNNSENTVYQKTFTWLFIGLLITFISGYSLTLNIDLLKQILAVGVLPIVILELIIAFVMGFFLQKLSPVMAKILFVLYCMLTGVTFSAIFIIYEMMSIISIFAISAGIFGALALYGYKTKKSLNNLGTILFFALIFLIIGEILNMLIFKAAGAELVFTIIGVLIFVGYIPSDTNKIPYMMDIVGEEKASVYCAFQLYLDFINLFIRLLELFGKRRD